MRLVAATFTVFALGAYIAVDHDGVSVLVGLALLVAVPAIALLSQRRR